MKNKIFLGMMSLGLLLTSPIVSAQSLEGAKVEFAGDNTVLVGEEFTVRMNATSTVEDGIVSLSGNLAFNSEQIEYVSAKEISAPYQFQINESYNYKIAGLDFTLDNGIKNEVTIFEFTFKALQDGETTITLENNKLTDTKNYVTTQIIPITVSIKNKSSLETEILPSTISEQNNINTNTSQVNSDNMIKSNSNTENKTVEEKENITELEVMKESTNKDNKKASEESKKGNIVETIKKVFKNIKSFFNKLFK